MTASAQGRLLSAPALFAPLSERTASRFALTSGTLKGVVVVEAETGMTFGRHTHDEFGIGLIHRGAQASASGRGPVEAGPGSIITVNPGEVHDGRPIGGTARHWRMLYIDPARMRESAQDVSEGRRETFEFNDPVIADRATADVLSPLLQAMTHGPDAAMAAEEGLLTLVARLARWKPSRAGRVSQARVRIDDDPSASVTLAMLAADAGLSRYQLLRAFSRETGLTPHAYLLQKRLGLARRLILENRPLAEIAAVAGFSDQSHMTRIFTRSFGFTPGRLASSLPAISFKTGSGDA